MIKMEKDTIIDGEMIILSEEAITSGRADEREDLFSVIDWLIEEPRTWGEALKLHADWCTWVIINLPDYLVANLAGFDRFDRTDIMAYRKDCPIDLEGLSTRQRAWVMIYRKDCPLDLEGLDREDKALISRFYSMERD